MTATTTTAASSSTTSCSSIGSYTTSSPGKIILSGEHAVVHGSKAIATVIDKRTYVNITVHQTNSNIDQHTNTAANTNNESNEQYIEFHIKHSQIQQSLKWSLHEIKQVRQELVEFIRHDHHQNNNNDNSNDSSMNGASVHTHSRLATNDIGADILQRFKNISHSYTHSHTLSTLSHYTSNPAVTVFLLYISTILSYDNNIAFTCHVESELPMGSGLGSSASYCSAVATATYNLQYIHDVQQQSSHTIQTQYCQCQSTASPSTLQQQQPRLLLCSHMKELINWWSLEGEKLIHGNPSGVDNTCCVYGGIIAYQRNTTANGTAAASMSTPSSSFSVMNNVPPVRLLISNTGVEKDTKKLVANVATLYQQYPSIIQPIFQSIDHISNTIIQMIKQYHDHINKADDVNAGMKEFESQLSTLFRINQHLLNALHVGHPSIDAIVQLCDTFQYPTHHENDSTNDKTKHHTFASKLTGAGGGGCVLTLIPTILLREQSDSHNIAHDSILRSTIKRLQDELLSKKLVVDCFETVIAQDGIRFEKCQ